jgi:flagellar protein FlgJ
MFVGDGYVTAGDGGLVAPLCGAPPLRRQPPPGATSGACSLTAPVALAAPYPSVSKFIAAAVPGAQRSQQETAVPASVTLAQAILETGGGRLAAGANNYFGMKAQAVTGQAGVFDWGTIADGCVLRKTQEVIRGRSVTTIGAFRAYAGLGDSIRDHGARLRANPVYAAAFDHTDDPERFARIIARHYATDPRYGTKVVQLMHRYKLERYDRAGASSSPAPAGAPASGDDTTGGAAAG